MHEMYWSRFLFHPRHQCLSKNNSTPVLCTCKVHREAQRKSKGLCAFAQSSLTAGLALMIDALFKSANLKEHIYNRKG